MKVLLTGAAGFIGFHIARKLLARGDEVVGVDSVNDYYSVSLKRDRLAQLDPLPRFTFLEMDLARPGLAEILSDAVAGTDVIVHFAAQAGVRYSTENPFAYVDSNVTGQVAMLELASRLPGKPPIVYASSSSVYGAAEEVPFSESARADKPISVYAATKRAAEMLAHSYLDLHELRSTGLRLFTVYGPYGRPDMAPWLFTDAILAGRPIQVFNDGKMERDFTYVDDIVNGVVAAADRLARGAPAEPIYNLGNNNPVQLLDFIAAIESACGRKAKLEMKPKPPGDVVRTCADITLAERDLGYAPHTRVATGMAEFVDWFRGYNNR